MEPRGVDGVLAAESSQVSFPGSVKRIVDDHDDDSTILQPKPHPLLNPFVLELVFQRLSRSALETCCCVSKTWNFEANRAIQKRIYGHVTIWGKIFDVPTTIQQIIRDGRRINELFLDNVHFDPVIQQLMEFIRHYSPSIDAIYIRKCRASAEVHHQIMSCIATNLTCLENLYLGPIGLLNVNGNLETYPYFPVNDLGNEGSTRFNKLKVLDYTSMGTTTRTYLSHVAVSCPNLVSLTVNGLPEEDSELYSTIRLPKLKSLYLNMLKESFAANTKFGLSTNNVRCLLAMKLNLRALNICNIHETTSVQLLKDWLGSMSSTLTKLQLSCSSIKSLKDSTYDSEYFTLPNPDLPPQPNLFPCQLLSLKEATIWKPYIKSMSALLNSAPKLIHLYLPFHDGTDWTSILPSWPFTISVHSSIKCLQLQWIPTAIFTKFVLKTFPNLTSLSLHDVRNTALIGLVFSNYEHSLKWLTLESTSTITSSITDEIITGLPKLPLAAGRGRIKQYIGNLKKLKGLCLNNGQFITKKSIQYGLADCPSLCFFTSEFLHVSEDFNQACEDIGLEEIQVEGHMDTPGYHYFLKQTKEDFEVGETPHEFVVRVSHVEGRCIQNLYLSEE